MIEILTIKINERKVTSHINENGYFCFQYKDIDLPKERFRDIISKQANISLDKIMVATSESYPDKQTTFTSPKCYFVKIKEQ